MNNREESIIWWNNLSDNDKSHFIEVYKDLLVGYPRTTNSLSGREIELIYDTKSAEDTSIVNSILSRKH